MSNPIPESLMNRIAKLLALAGNNPDEHEVAAAMAKANTLLAKYNMSLADVEARAGQKSTSTSERTESIVKAAFYTWQKLTWAAVAKMNFCYLLTWRTSEWNEKTMKSKSVNKVIIIGREHNVAATIEMGKYIVQAIEDLSINYVNGDNKLRLSKKVMSWKAGCSDRVNRRIYDLIKEREAAEFTPSQSTALVKFQGDEDAENTKYAKAKYTPKSTKLARASVERSAYNAGYDSGDRIGLNTQVGAGGGNGHLNG